MRVDVYRKSNNEFITCYPVTGYKMAAFTVACLLEKNLIHDDEGFEVIHFLHNPLSNDDWILDMVRLRIVDKD